MEKSNDFKNNDLSTLALCPKCGSENIRTSSKHSKNDLYHFLFYKSYRCRVCHWRFEDFMPSRVFLTIGILFFFVAIPILSILYVGQQSTPEVLTKQDIELTQLNETETELELGIDYKRQNEPEAVKFYEKAAQKGNIKAKYHYGLALIEGNGVLQNYKEGIHWLEQAAKSGHVKAQYMMGDIYYRGVGVPKDELRAYLWFMLAAAKNESAAFYMRDKIAGSLSLEQIALIQEEAKKIAATQELVPSKN